jgi:hypothetical protein
MNPPGPSPFPLPVGEGVRRTALRRDGAASSAHRARCDRDGRGPLTEVKAQETPPFQYSQRSPTQKRLQLNSPSRKMIAPGSRFDGSSYHM